MIERRSVFTLPKAHLHAHLILSARRETMAELADRYGVDLGDAWTRGSLGELIQKSSLAFGLIRTPDDLARLCREFVEDEATQGVAYTQLMMGVGLLSRQLGLSPEEVFAIHEEAMLAASAATGVEVGLMFGILRHGPTSNVALGTCSEIEAHQIPALLEAGVPITLNADDQLFFGPKVAEEYALVRSAFDVTDEQLAEIARTSARASGAPAGTVARMLDGTDAWLAADPASASGTEPAAFTGS